MPILVPASSCQLQFINQFWFLRVHARSSSYTTLGQVRAGRRVTVSGPSRILCEFAILRTLLREVGCSSSSQLEYVSHINAQSYCSQWFRRPWTYVAAEVLTAATSRNIASSRQDLERRECKEMWNAYVPSGEHLADDSATSEMSWSTLSSPVSDLGNARGESLQHFDLF